MTSSWTSGVPAATATVECGAESHTVMWQDGEFLVPAHPDPDGERALAALGGAPCPCVALLTTWERHAADPRVLILGPRGRNSLAPGSDIAARLRPYGLRTRSGRGLPVGEQPPDALEQLLGLEGAIPRRLVATVAEKLCHRTREPALWPAMYAALIGRVEPVMKRWTHGGGGFVLEMTDGDRGLECSADGDLLIRLPFRWISEVWARDLDIVAGEFVLSAESMESGTLKVTTVNHAMVVRTQPPRLYE